ncbi:glycerophosphodiester phosphodiesterase family protein [Pedobacter sp. SYP-B3415]|uniref:glycerophosphodiester phosphodiesterase family protein n=1 Tax=Pedobacter sp. SYP-B3415 TaxID=2496641 RepID=UPI00101BFD6F|nr:glycerophosphodiester phosphodiesterase family protein [Pedobacter sp. SYP-B3415]
MKHLLGRAVATGLLMMIAISSFSQKTWNMNGIIAHRGAWKKQNLPENSIASLKEAVKLGCYGAEFDVWMTADNVIVVNHDPDFYGMSIEKSTYKQLLEKTHPNGEKIPTLEAYLKAGIKQKGTRLILEIKSSKVNLERSLDLTTRAVAAVKKYKATKWVDYIAFSYDVCKKILELQPGAVVTYLNGDVAPSKLKADGLSGADYHYSVYQKNDGWLEEMRKLNLSTNAWTVNAAEDMQWLLAHHIDYITTNEPELLIEERKKSPALQGWKLVWSDEFNYRGLPADDRWTYDEGGNGWGNNELQFYTKADSANTMVNKGILTITARRERRENRDYTSARLLSKGKFDWKYGRVEVRAMLPGGKGLWPAIWMLPTEWKYGGWPKSGEIDIMEHVGYEPDTVYGSVHTEKFNHVIHTQVTKGIKVADPYKSYHIYAAEWFEDRIDFFVDGEKYLSFPKKGNDSTSWPFDQKFHLLLNVAVGGNWGGAKGLDPNVYPAQLKVDYVRVFQK